MSRLPNSQRKRKQRQRLFKEQNGLCYWCGCEMVIIPYVKNRIPPSNEATIDHLDSRLNPARGTFQDLPIRRRVMACRSCNEERARLEEAALPIEDLWRRSNRHAA